LIFSVLLENVLLTQILARIWQIVIQNYLTDHPKKIKTKVMIANRMRKVREVRGWKQSAVADSMNITQQAYSFLEQGHGSPRIDTLKRFCEVMKVELSFLMSFDVPVTEETIEKYGTKGFAELISEHKRLEQKLEFFNYLIKNNTETTDKNKSMAMASGQ
jgi:transcriptional regulator with XRE-family HTH domain